MPAEVLVTGAARGIGFGLANGYAAAGACVVATHRPGGTPPAAIAGVEWAPLDVADPEAQRALGAALAARPLDILVCNAAIYPARADRLADGFAAADWAAAVSVNVTGVFLTVQAHLARLRAARGRIAILSSAMGSQARAPGGAYIYRATKAAVTNLGRNLAADLRAEGIAVGVYHPGWVQTEMGGPGAEIDVATSVAGLMARFEALDLSDTGCFRTHEGAAIPF
jgi:NAD(P)-dependent dehydrogenase (short-subunit alcohol dehydrogenase family)